VTGFEPAFSLIIALVTFALVNMSRAIFRLGQASEIFRVLQELRRFLPARGIRPLCVGNT
jgi:hypothetical protein